MILHIVYAVVLFGAGFGVGRIKNKAKLAAVSAEVTKLETAVAPVTTVAVADVKSFIATVKSKL